MDITERKTNENQYGRSGKKNSKILNDIYIIKGTQVLPNENYLK
jgi:hypothetical protein